MGKLRELWRAVRCMLFHHAQHEELRPGVWFCNVCQTDWVNKEGKR